jgi:hypothetical protein
MPHDGMFMAPGDLQHVLDTVGFEATQERFHAVHWPFNSAPEAHTFLRTLFRMTRAADSDVASALETAPLELVDCRDVEKTRTGAHGTGSTEACLRYPDSVVVMWGLNYGQGTKPSP